MSYMHLVLVVEVPMNDKLTALDIVLTVEFPDITEGPLGVCSNSTA